MSTDDLLNNDRFTSHLNNPDDAPNLKKEDRFEKSVRANEQTERHEYGFITYLKNIYYYIVFILETFIPRIPWIIVASSVIMIVMVIKKGQEGYQYFKAKNFYYQEVNAPPIQSAERLRKRL